MWCGKFVYDFYSLSTVSLLHFHPAKEEMERCGSSEGDVLLLFQRQENKIVGPSECEEMLTLHVRELQKAHLS